MGPHTRTPKMLRQPSLTEVGPTGTLRGPEGG